MEIFLFVKINLGLHAYHRQRCGFDQFSPSYWLLSIDWINQSAHTRSNTMDQHYYALVVIAPDWFGEWFFFIVNVKSNMIENDFKSTTIDDSSSDTSFTSVSVFLSAITYASEKEFILKTSRCSYCWGFIAIWLVPILPFARDKSDEPNWNAHCSSLHLH